MMVAKFEVLFEKFYPCYKYTADEIIYPFNGFTRQLALMEWRENLTWIERRPFRFTGATEEVKTPKFVAYINHRQQVDLSCSYLFHAN